MSKSPIVCTVKAGFVDYEKYKPQEGSTCLIVAGVDDAIIEAVSGYKDGHFLWEDTIDKNEAVYAQVYLWAYEPFPSDEVILKYLKKHKREKKENMV